MTRKVIQVVSDPHALIVLCDDGTMWQQVGSGWQQIPGPTESTLAAELVAELRRIAHICSASAESTGSRAFAEAADLVAEKLGVES